MKSPQISVVMLTYNREKYLRESIGSVLNQTVGDLELIVVDDGSTDGSRDLVISLLDPRIRYYFFEHSRHGSKLRNFGISASTGEFVAFLDSDDVWLPDKLQRQLHELQSNPQAGFSFTDVEEFSDDGKILKSSLYPRTGNKTFCGSIFEDYSNNRLAIYPSSVVFRRSCYDILGPLVEEFKWTDNEFLHRLAYRYPACILYDSLVRIRKHDGNHSTMYLHDTVTEMIPLFRSLRAKGMISRATYHKMTGYYFYMSGMLHYRDRNFAEARSSFRKSIWSAPWNPKTWIRFASVLLR